MQATIASHARIAPNQLVICLDDDEQTMLYVTLHNASGSRVSVSRMTKADSFPEPLRCFNRARNHELTIGL